MPYYFQNITIYVSDNKPALIFKIWHLKYNELTTSTRQNKLVGVIKMFSQTREIVKRGTVNLGL